MNNNTIKAAEDYAIKLMLGPKAVQHFMAGAEYKQQKIDELVEKVMRYAADIDELVSAIDRNNEVLKAFNYRHTQIQHNDKLIQKHRP